MRVRKWIIAHREVGPKRISREHGDIPKRKTVKLQASMKRNTLYLTDSFLTTMTLTKPDGSIMISLNIR